MNIKDHANAVRRLLEDETFQGVMTAVKQEQLDTFANVSSTIEQREEAHTILRALNRIEIHISTVLADERMYDRQK